MISFEKVKEEIEKMGYYATDELLYDTYNALMMFNNNEINPGQDIFAICLEGPPGAGKTEFAKTYTKLSNKLFKNVELVDYQCDATTGKTELFEDINISAAIRGDADNVNIPGKLIEAIKKVNEGKKVVLFIDEYDKAREETDAFLLQFLQSGKINSTQHGDLEIKEEYKGNLQVILCKNDMREELSGPLSRRIRIIRLDYMEPSLLYKIIHRLLVEEKTNPVNDGLINLVSLMYEKAYANKEMYNRLPSCSEMLIATEDADRIVKTANAPQSIVYNIIIRNMFKSLDDITTFESSLNKMKNQNESGLVALIKSMKINNQSEEKINLNELIAKTVYQDQSKELTKKTEQMEELIEKYQNKFKQIEQERKKTIINELNSIKLENGTLVSTNKFPNTINNFEDESINIKRGQNIFEISDNDWTEFATITKPNLSHNYFISKLVEYANKLDIKIYENGILLKEEDDLKLIVICNMKNNELEFKILSNYLVMSPNFFSDIENFIKFVNDCYNIQPKSTNALIDDALNNNGICSFNGFIYNEKEMLSPNITCEKTDFAENCYLINFSQDLNEQLDKFVDLEKELSISASSEMIIDTSKQLFSGNQKVKK